MVVRVAQVLFGHAAKPSGLSARSKWVILSARLLSSSSTRRALRVNDNKDGDNSLNEAVKGEDGLAPRPEHEHAVISAFDLFSIGGEYRCFERDVR